MSQKSVLKRMGLVKRMPTTSKVEIPEGAKKEAQFMYLYNKVALVAEYDAPPSLVLNLDQTPLKYIPAERQSLEKKAAKSVSNFHKLLSSLYQDIFPNAVYLWQ